MKSEVLFEPVQLPVMKIAKEQVFGAKTSGESNPSSSLVAGNGQRDNTLLALPQLALTKKPEDSGYEIVSRK